MAPIKFEENIREKLQERELQPSTEAWSKLADKLPEKRQDRTPWLAIAASATGILLVVTFLFTSEKNTSNTNLVTQDPLPATEKGTESDARPRGVHPKSNDVLVAGDNIVERETNASEDEVLLTNSEEKGIATNRYLKNNPVKTAAANSEENKNPAVDNLVEEGIAKANEDKPKSIEKNKIIENDPFVNTKVEEVIASIQNIQDKNNTVTVAEIDDLLKKAQRDISTHRILNSNSFKVDATALLEDVETELERSFRNKVFDALGAGFDKVRTAVANRNN